MTNDHGQVILYKAKDGFISLDVKLRGETVWLSLNQMASLFERDKSVISRHLRNVYESGELDRVSTVASFATVQNEGGRRIERQIEYFKLWFLQKNAALYRPDGTKRIADNALVAMTLLIAESRPEEKDLPTRVLMHLIHAENS